MAGTYLVVQWLRLCFPMLEIRVPNLVQDLRSYIPQGQKNIKQKQYYNKFNKNLKNFLGMMALEIVKEKNI